MAFIYVKNWVESKESPQQGLYCRAGGKSGDDSQDVKLACMLCYLIASMPGLAGAVHKEACWSWGLR